VSWLVRNRVVVRQNSVVLEQIISAAVAMCARHRHAATFAIEGPKTFASLRLSKLDIFDRVPFTA
jgi:hypothetical protein